jgi:hypothetical protein
MAPAEIATLVPAATPAPAPVPAQVAQEPPAPATPALAVFVPVTPQPQPAAAKSSPIVEEPRTPKLEASARTPFSDKPAFLPQREVAAAVAMPMPASKPPAVPTPVVTHDFPWIAGAKPARIDEETTVGVGARMYGRLFAKVEFGSALGAADAADSPLNEARVKAAGQVSCVGVTCLDVARELMLQDAQRKGWRVMLNRRVAMHQSFLFQRDDRAAWVEIKSPSKNTLDIDYALVPVQDSSAQR